MLLKADFSIEVLLSSEYGGKLGGALCSEQGQDTYTVLMHQKSQYSCQTKNCCYLLTEGANTTVTLRASWRISMALRSLSNCSLSCCSSFSSNSWQRIRTCILVTVKIDCNGYQKKCETMNTYALNKTFSWF